LPYLQNLPKAAPKDNSTHGIAVEEREAAERECARAKGVGSGERKARTAKQPQGPAQEPKRSEFLFVRRKKSISLTTSRSCADIFEDLHRRNMERRRG
jgi:hypothetical protein